MDKEVKEDELMSLVIQLREEKRIPDEALQRIISIFSPPIQGDVKMTVGGIVYDAPCLFRRGETCIKGTVASGRCKNLNAHPSRKDYDNLRCNRQDIIPLALGETTFVFPDVPGYRTDALRGFQTLTWYGEHFSQGSVSWWEGKIYDKNCRVLRRRDTGK